METIKDLIVKHKFFHGLDKKYLELISGCGANVNFKKGEFIFREGEKADNFYIIRSGSVSIETFANGKGELIVQTIGADDILGWSWLFHPYRWHFDVKAREVTRLIRFDGECLRKKCENDNQFGYEFLKRFSYLITKRLEATRLQLLDVYGLSGSGEIKKK